MFGFAYLQETSAEVKQELEALALPYIAVAKRTNKKLALKALDFYTLIFLPAKKIVVVAFSFTPNALLLGLDPFTFLSTPSWYKSTHVYGGGYTDISTTTPAYLSHVKLAKLSEFSFANYEHSSEVQTLANSQEILYVGATGENTHVWYEYTEALSYNRDKVYEDLFYDTLWQPIVSSDKATVVCFFQNYIARAAKGLMFFDSNPVTEVKTDPLFLRLNLPRAVLRSTQLTILNDAFVWYLGKNAENITKGFYCSFADMLELLHTYDETNPYLLTTFTFDIAYDIEVSIYPVLVTLPFFGEIEITVVKDSTGFSFTEILYEGNIFELEVQDTSTVTDITTGSVTGLTTTIPLNTSLSFSISTKVINRYNDVVYLVPMAPFEYYITNHFDSLTYTGTEDEQYIETYQYTDKVTSELYVGIVYYQQLSEFSFLTPIPGSLDLSRYRNDYYGSILNILESYQVTNKGLVLVSPPPLITYAEGNSTADVHSKTGTSSASSYTKMSTYDGSKYIDSQIDSSTIYTYYDLGDYDIVSTSDITPSTLPQPDGLNMTTHINMLGQHILAVSKGLGVEYNPTTFKFDFSYRELYDGVTSPIGLMGAIEYIGDNNPSQLDTITANIRYDEIVNTFIHPDYIRDTTGTYSFRTGYMEYGAYSFRYDSNIDIISWDVSIGILGYSTPAKYKEQFIPYHKGSYALPVYSYNLGRRLHRIYLIGPSFIPIGSCIFSVESAALGNMALYFNMYNVYYELFKRKHDANYAAWSKLSDEAKGANPFEPEIDEETGLYKYAFTEADISNYEYYAAFRLIVENEIIPNIVYNDFASIDLITTVLFSEGVVNQSLDYYIMLNA